MKKIVKILGLIFVMLFSSCFQGKQYASKYAGTYYCYGGHHYDYHYYWGKTSITNDYEMAQSIQKIVIDNDLNVIATYSWGEEKGKAYAKENSIKFDGISDISGYRFDYSLSDDNSRNLIYYYSEDKYGLEYNTYTEKIVFRERVTKEYETEITLQNSVAEYYYENVYEDRKDTSTTNKNYNGLTHSSIYLNFKENRFSLILNETTQNGNLVPYDSGTGYKCFTLKFDDDVNEPLINEKIVFKYSENADNYAYFNTYSYFYPITTEYGDYNRIDYYALSFNIKMK